jgi:hypothetical protein
VGTYFNTLHRWHIVDDPCISHLVLSLLHASHDRILRFDGGGFSASKLVRLRFPSWGLDMLAKILNVLLEAQDFVWNKDPFTGNKNFGTILWCLLMNISHCWSRCDYKSKSRFAPQTKVGEASIHPLTSLSTKREHGVI